MAKFNLSSGQLLAQLEKVRGQMQGSSIAGRISVDESAAWWYFQEFGTATHQNPGTVEVPPSVSIQEPETTSNPTGYAIHPRNGQYIVLPAANGYTQPLAVPYVGEGGAGGPMYTENHPGVEAQALVRTVLEEIHQNAVQEIASALHTNGYTTSTVREALMGTVLPNALKSISRSINEKLDAGQSPTAKLRGQSPSVVFEQAATITEDSGE